MAVKATYGLDISPELRQCYSMSMMSDGGGGSIFGPIHGGTQGALGGQIRDESLRATVAELGRKVEEIRRILSGLNLETIAVPSPGYSKEGEPEETINVQRYQVLGKPSGGETISLSPPEGVPPGAGTSLWDIIQALIDAALAAVQATIEGVQATVETLLDLINNPETGLIAKVATLVAKLAGYNDHSITLCGPGGTTTTGVILFKASTTPAT